MCVSRGKTVTEALGQCKLESEYFIEWAIIDQVKSHKVLGIHLDQNLDFDVQTEALCKSLSNKIGFLKRISPFLKRSHKVLYYDVVLKPSFLYGSSVWSSTSKANLNSILRLQKRAARVILNASFNSRSVDLFNTLNWIPFYRESHINQCAFIYKRL